MFTKETIFTVIVLMGLWGLLLIFFNLDKMRKYFRRKRLRKKMQERLKSKWDLELKQV